ncbi:MAG: FAD-dependent monooxygenase [Pseudomonadota bacterium]
MTKRVEIFGAGICGLTTALALFKTGWSVTIADGASELSEAGAGIQLSPNAMRVLLSLGMRDALRPSASIPKAVRVRRGDDGKVLSTVRLGEHAQQKYAAPYWVVHRADLQAALLEAVRSCGIDVRLGVDGNASQSVDTDLTVLATGLHGGSAVSIDPDAPQPTPSGHRAWRAIVAMNKAPRELEDMVVTAWLLPGAHIVTYPVHAGQSLNIVVILPDNDQGKNWSEPRGAIEAETNILRLSNALQDVLSTVGEWQTWSLWRRAPLNRWSGRARLVIGDAAHPTLPFLAQGGAMAIEDAASLAHHLNQDEDVPTALRAFELARKSRTTRLQRAADENGRIFHMRGAMAAARDATLRFSPQALIERRFDWIYSYRPN